MTDIQKKKVSVVQISDKEAEVHQIDVDTVSLQDIGPRFGCRHVQILLLCFALICGISTRTNLSVAIVAMTDNTTSPNPDIPTYHWNNTSIILSSFFLSYMTLQVLAGYLGKTYGPKYFLLTGFFINFCLVALIPTAAERLGSKGVILCRALQGLGQGFLYPSSHVILGRWAPQEERTTLNNIAFSGSSIGAITGSLVTGFVSSSWWGWPASFYILSALGFCWCIVWLCFGQNSPATHPRITPEEKSYIQKSLSQEDNVDLPVPWKEIFTCRPFYVLMLAFIGNGWDYSVLLTETPTYLANVMNFNMQSNAVVTAIPTLVQLICGLITGPLSDWIVARKFVTVLTARKIFDGIGSFGQALCLIWLSSLKSSQSALSVFVLALGSGLTNFVLVGCYVNHLDLSPRFSGVLYGILNAVGQAVSVIGPLSANWIVTDPTDASQWRIVFLIAAGFYIAGGTVFSLFASTTRQTWDGPANPQLEERRKKISVVSLMSI